jgi:RNA polymerase sigma-70 factor (ECF subfamily)
MSFLRRLHDVIAPGADPRRDTAEARLEALLAEYGAVLRAAIRRACPPDRLADLADLEQAARIRLWRALQRESGVTHPASYIHRVAASVAIDAIRRARRRPEDPIEPPGDERPSRHEPEDPEPSPAARVEHARSKAAVEAALGALAENRRRAVGLHLRGFTTTEIGAMLDWTEAKARNLVYRGLQDLRTRLREQGIDVDDA